MVTWYWWVCCVDVGDARTPPFGDQASVENCLASVRAFERCPVLLVLGKHLVHEEEIMCETEVFHEFFLVFAKFGIEVAEYNDWYGMHGDGRGNSSYNSVELVPPLGSDVGVDGTIWSVAAKNNK